MGRKRKRENLLVGKYVKKEFQGYGTFIGKVVSYNDGLYRLDYEDGDFEDLEKEEVIGILVNENEFDQEFKARRNELDELVRKKFDESHSVVAVVSGNNKKTECRVEVEVEEKNKDIEKKEDDMELDSSSDSSEFVRVRECVVIVPPPEFPCSSGNIGVPEECVSYLLSVYSFLRSYSILLYLSPFRLDDFVGAVNCASSNALMDAVHLALLRALRRHLEMLSSDGAKLASKCLRRLDWSLLDTLTWPVYLVEYLMVMGYAKGQEWKGFYTDVLDGDYYNLSVTKKLMIMQILCDDIMESVELRTEIDTRESLEEGNDISGIENPSLPGPKRVHPKRSKTSFCKDLGVIDSKSTNSKSICGPNLAFKVPEVDTETTDVDQDGNSDECLLCGMDGTLLCCDGCPSAYHSRCIGLSKILIPDGLWFCPECTARNIEPTLRISSGLRGAQIFGIDPYEQLFLGICDHLLVLNVSIASGPSSRYYSQTDIVKVLQILFSTEQHKTLYSEICKKIMQYWEILEGSIVSHPEGTEAARNTATDVKEDTKVSAPVYAPNSVLKEVEEGFCGTSGIVSNVENVMLSGQENVCQEVQVKTSSLETVNQDSHLVLQRIDGVMAQMLSPPTGTKTCEQFVTESLVSSGSTNHYPNHSDLTQQSCVESSTALDYTTCAQEGSADTEKKGVGSIVLPKKNGSFSMSSEKVEGTIGGGGTSKGDKVGGSLYTGNLFIPQAYINQYFPGDIAASAAANLAVVASEEKGVSEANASSNPRKILAANIALQLKAFSSASIRFIWPSSEKKVIETPRERCGWCLSCRANTTSRKGCLLNFAASNAFKGCARNVVNPRPLKNGEGLISGIATYILCMEEGLRGLLVGPFLKSTDRKQWRKAVESASTCSALRYSLLQLEEHIRLVAFSGDWVKFVDDWMVESSTTQNTTGSVGPPPKRPGGRRNKKQAAISVVARDPSDDDLRIVNWWRGGKLSKLIFQKGILPCSIVRKAARQGGRRKISGICYAESSETPKRSRRYAWRAAAEISKNAPQLALQVRYLDLHLRWSDMVRSEQNSHDGKGTEAETSIYRNARICDKLDQENKIRYALIFNQKHLPSRVMKNTISVEQNEAGEEKFWFSETHVPLYLIKDFEQKAEKDNLPAAKTLPVLSKLQRQQIKAFRRNIFSYLMQKEEKVDKCPCASCQQDLLVGDAVKCNECEGYCHKDCTSQLTVDMKNEVEHVVTCNQCYRAKPIALNKNNFAPVNQLFLRGQDCKMAVTMTKDMLTDGYHQPLVSVENTETQSLIKSVSAGHNSSSRGKRGTAYGILWKKNGSKETGSDFRFSNILCKSSGEIHPSKRPTCYLCSKPYNPDLMYVRCEDCELWYHADAIRLNESQLFDVIGFKCGRCRRSRHPLCPYADPESAKLRFRSYADPESTKPRIRSLKQHNRVMEPESETISERPLGLELTAPVSSEKMEEVVTQEDDPLLFSLARVEPISEFSSDFGSEWDTTRASFQGPQKLPIRRHVKLENEPSKQKLPVRRNVKRESDPDGSFISPYEESAPFGANSFMVSENASPPQVEWEFPIDPVKDELFDCNDVSYENMEFEPQTYFSLTELLATDDTQSGLCDGSMDIDGDWVNSGGYEGPPYNLPDRYEMRSTNNNEELSTKAEPVESNVPCHMCLLTEPAPEFFCEGCKLWTHRHCSPWVDTTLGSSWRCDLCRDWA
ncbi:hypothetical protein IFM89_015256 [Coptis chinensis]|uniref:Uncharacterized protein n=1 Tax=Coptis chinensis TaxID=261450 RepID=A0A835HB32_9MAGN|nr:hypothetical protein IFM89_015256 [Coptis chinensis]